MLPPEVLNSMVSVGLSFDESLTTYPGIFIAMGDSSAPSSNPSTPTKHQKKGWGFGLPSLWVANQTHLPRLSESEYEDNDSNPAASFHMQDSYADTKEEKSNTKVLILESQGGSQEAPDLDTERLHRVAHGQLEGKLRRNAMSFDQQVMESASDMPIPEDFSRQQDGFMSSLYKSLQGVHWHRAPTASQPSSAESSRCNSPTGFLAERVKENQIGVVVPGMRNKGREAFFRDLNVTGPSSW